MTDDLPPDGAERPPGAATPAVQARKGPVPGARPAELQALLQRLADQPWAYNFYAALRRIDALNAPNPPLGQAARPADEPIRLGQPPSMSFAPSDLVGLVRDPRAAAPRLDVRFFGLFGPHGSLPGHLSDYAHERQGKGDTTLTAFANVFHHRLLLLFYRAWAQAQPTVQLDRPQDDRFARYAASLAGFGAPGAAAANATPAHLRLFFAGRFAQQARNADGLQAVLATYFRVPVQIEEFVGTWLALPRDERSQLKRWPDRGQQLGAGVVLGRSVWDVQHQFGIVIGPIRFERFESLLNQAQELAELQSIVRDYVNDMLGWRLTLRLLPQEVPAARLGGAQRLGRSTWLQRATPRSECADVRVEPEALMRRARRPAAAHRTPTH